MPNYLSYYIGFIAFLTTVEIIISIQGKNISKGKNIILSKELKVACILINLRL